MKRLTCTGLLFIAALLLSLPAAADVPALPMYTLYAVSRSVPILAIALIVIAVAILVCAILRKRKGK